LGCRVVNELALKQRFQVGCAHQLSLNSIESNDILDDSVEYAAVTMRKLQLLYLIGDPDRDTSSDVVVGLCVELVRELGRLQSLAPDIALDLEAGLWPLQEALFEVTNALARHRSPTPNHLVVFGS
jgi:hypothetical protein